MIWKVLMKHLNLIHTMKSLYFCYEFEVSLKLKKKQVVSLSKWKLENEFEVIRKCWLTLLPHWSKITWLSSLGQSLRPCGHKSENIRDRKVLESKRRKNRSIEFTKQTLKLGISHGGKRCCSQSYETFKEWLSERFYIYNCP